VAGDMFIAALLDAFPDHTHAVITGAELVAPVRCEAVRHRDHVLTGLRFKVEQTKHDPYHHQHSSWTDIRRRIGEAALSEPIKHHATGIFSLLAEAEGKVHGIDPEAVMFHEVGAADSIADIVGAAVLIAAVGEARWSVAPLPIGRGRVQTSHGIMPVPAPATALLLEGFATIDDGIGGERVTPTGAAILRWLGCEGTLGFGAKRLRGSGFGFGSKNFPGLSNCLRVLVFDQVQRAETPAGHRELAVISFEIDDQTPEDLAMGLDRLREMAGVHDVVQIPAFGKKGRMIAHVQALVRPESVEEAVEACFRETTTIGLRTQLVRGSVLPRETAEVDVNGEKLRVKLVDRPGGFSGKTEADDVRSLPDHTARAKLRREAENRAVARIHSIPGRET
jgi:pyridinium-3,5-bisthiocarboxylic acid mononucleotide nickel chelatase